ncbi:GNAT family N-acetyltransferase [Streptomyces sp. JV178]|uniref:GNAT family N-acetyltransferase n=1 Tax=Streptomyces sp. JV178 TaxID=858632 RepID=UPI000C1B1235|nr:GNAT family N-acetyltransferase [Streptomyces sp. JV178]PIM66249.1 GNAT family N-acetyltransferase [Streptomyces sp. JV178]
MPSLVTPAISAGALAASGQPTLVMEGEALLRPWCLADAEAVVAAFRDPEIQRWHVRRADSVEEARTWIESWQSSWRDEAGGHWAVSGADGEGLLGRVSLKSLDLADGSAEVAYWMVPTARGEGTCTRAVMTLTKWALEQAGFHRLELEHSMANQASCRVAIKAGFKTEGIRRGAALHADGWHDMHLHACVGQS